MGKVKSALPMQRLFQIRKTVREFERLEKGVDKLRCSIYLFQLKFQPIWMADHERAISNGAGGVDAAVSGSGVTEREQAV